MNTSVKCSVYRQVVMMKQSHECQHVDQNIKYKEKNEQQSWNREAIEYVK